MDRQAVWLLVVIMLASKPVMSAIDELRLLDVLLFEFFNLPRMHA